MGGGGAGHMAGMERHGIHTEFWKETSWNTPTWKTK
jgi:hypothetical protein